MHIDNLITSGIREELERRRKEMKFSTRQIVVTGLLTALTVALGATGMGLVPVPTPAIFATILHVPVIIAGILEGPIVGAFVGLLFGLFTLTAVPDPRIVIPARLIIGLVAWLAFKGTRMLFRTKTTSRSQLRLQLGIAGAVAGLMGTITNTAGTLSLAVLFDYINAPTAWGIAAANGVPEALIAAFLVGGLATVLGPWIDKH